MQKSVVTISPNVLSGEPVFTGTRVPIRALLDHIEAGDTIDDFIDGFPSVSRDQVIAFLEQATHELIAKVDTAA